MEDVKLEPYYNQYILLMRDQKQLKQSFSVEQLQEFIMELFNSLQYKNDQSDGKIRKKFSLGFCKLFISGQLTFSTCQICLDEGEPMVTMKVILSYLFIE
jgi:hypothetical protein